MLERFIDATLTAVKAIFGRAQRKAIPVRASGPERGVRAGRRRSRR